VFSNQPSSSLNEWYQDLEKINANKGVIRTARTLTIKLNDGPPLAESPAQACSLITSKMSIPDRNIQTMGHISQQNESKMNQHKGGNTHCNNRGVPPASMPSSEPESFLVSVKTKAVTNGENKSMGAPRRPFMCWKRKAL